VIFAVEAAESVAAALWRPSLTANLSSSACGAAFATLRLAGGTRCRSGAMANPRGAYL